MAGPLTACVVCYVVHRHRERVRWAKIRKEQVGKLKQLKRLRWYKGKIG